jgi:UPF0755 protein
VVALSLLLGITVGAALATVWWVKRFAAEPGPGAGKPVALSWPDGLSEAEAAGLLYDLGLVHSARAMEIYLHSTRGTACIAPGPHLLPRGLAPPELCALLCRDADRPTAKMTIPEGYHRFAIATRLEDKHIAASEAFLHATSDLDLLHRLGVEVGEASAAASAEGYLFPATYKFALNTAPQSIVKRLVGEAKRRVARLAKKHAGGMQRLNDELQWGEREILTLASMVEKEAAVADERTVIASVFFNRLQNPEFRPKYLQSDPTAAYGCWAMPEQIPACANFEGKVTPAINRDRANVFSTYVSEGLPPGPVANPGDASIEAVLAPDDTPYLYFVAKGAGRHTFSETYDAHNEAVRALRERRAAE